VESTDTFTLTATGDDGSSVAISFNATGATVANVTAGLAAAWNASTHRLAKLAVAADNTTNLTLTAVTAGVPFSVAATTTDHGGANTQTLTRAATQANIGPNDVSLAGNYQANVMFVASDTVTIAGLAAESLLYGLNQSAITLTKLDVKRPASIYVGNPDQAYYLRVSATTLNIGEQVPGASSTGSQFIAIDTGSNAATVNLFSSTTSGLNGLPPVLLKGSHASNVLNILGGNGGLGLLTPGEASSFPNINMLDGTFTVGSGRDGADAAQPGRRDVHPQRRRDDGEAERRHAQPRRQRQHHDLLGGREAGLHRHRQDHHAGGPGRRRGGFLQRPGDRRGAGHLRRHRHPSRRRHAEHRQRDPRQPGHRQPGAALSRQHRGRRQSDHQDAQTHAVDDRKDLSRG
jgi:hypothetical protein